MISIILYGRNDNYGYNLHKRAALSFNCMAEVLEAEEDEILFVDYNTPNDFPTFPEAIQDTLSPRARAKLRILRVRPHVHHRFSSLTRLVALEPIARNVGVRRSNPANRWVLSTNTDMIFVPRYRVPLNEIVRDLRPDSITRPASKFPRLCGKVWIAATDDERSRRYGNGDPRSTSTKWCWARRPFSMTGPATFS